MKIKTASRIVGALDAALWSYVGYIGYQVLSSFPYEKLQDFFFGDYPLEYKVGAAASIMFMVASPPVVVLGITDGLVDLVKGTHHYFGLQVWKRLTRNQKRKEKIDTNIKEMLERIEEPIYQTRK